MCQTDHMDMPRVSEIRQVPFPWVSCGVNFAAVMMPWVFWVGMGMEQPVEAIHVFITIGLALVPAVLSGALAFVSGGVVHMLGFDADRRFLRVAFCAWFIQLNYFFCFVWLIATFIGISSE